MPLPPLKFAPRLVEKMWGGRKLGTLLGKSQPPGVPVGESWELYDFPPGVVGGSVDWVSSVVAGGDHDGRTLHDLMTSDGAALLGDAKPVETPHGPQFPLLVKFLDAEQDLSVQVHPDEAYAAANPGAHLKNEAWHVLAVEENARLLRGTTPGTTRGVFEQALKSGTVERHLRSIPGRVGDTFYLPSGTVHALGAGLLVAEVQTPSDTTYRVHDFDRVDPSTGEKRALHVDRAMACIDFDAPSPAGPDAMPVEAPQFTMAERRATTGTPESIDAGLAVLIVLDGSGTLEADGASVGFGRGDTVLLPASAGIASLSPSADCRWLHLTLPTG